MCSNHLIKDQQLTGCEETHKLCEVTGGSIFQLDINSSIVNWKSDASEASLNPSNNYFSNFVFRGPWYPSVYAIVIRNISDWSIREAARLFSSVKNSKIQNKKICLLFTND